MKITKQQLRRIIKEEIASIDNNIDSSSSHLNEQAYNIGDHVYAVEDAYYKNANSGPAHFISKGMPGEITDFAEDEDGEFYIISFVIKQGYTQGSGQNEILKIIVDADAMDDIKKL